MYDHLPGGEILSKGLKDLQEGLRSVDAPVSPVCPPDEAKVAYCMAAPASACPVAMLAGTPVPMSCAACVSKPETYADCAEVMRSKVCVNGRKGAPIVTLEVKP